MNDVSLLAITCICMHDATSRLGLRASCYCYGSFSYVVKLRNRTRFILELMTELRFEVSVNRHSIQIYFIAVFVKIVNVECALSKAYQVLTQVNSNLKVTTIFERKTV